MDKKRIFNIIKKIFVHTAALGCIAVAVFATMFFINYKFVEPATAKSDRYYINDIYDQPITQLKDGKTFEQEFEAHGDIFGVQIRWHNLAIVQDGTALIEVVDADTEEVLTSTVYDLHRIVNDVYNEIAFDTPYYNSEEGYQPYILRITPTFDNPEESYLKIWGDSATGNIAFGILEYIVDADSLYGWFGLVRKVAFVGAVVIYAACFIFKFKKETVFVICLLAVSCLFTLVLPPYSSPDEEGHFNSAYRMVNKWDGYGDEDFTYLRFYKRASDKNKLFEDKNTTTLTYEYIFNNLDTRCENDETITLENAWLVTDFGGVYFMGAVGIKLAHMLGLGYVQMMYLGRFMNLLFFALCIFFAIKITPVGKEVFMALSMLPITIHVANSFSRDTFVISLAFLFTAYLLYLLKQQENYKWWQLLLLAVICALLAPSKFIYVTLCLGVLLLDWHKVPLLNRINWKIPPIVLVVVAAAITLPALAYIMLQKNPDFRWYIFAMAPLEVLLDPSTNDFGFSLQLIAQNPVYFLKIIMNTIFANGAYYIKSIAGGVLSYNSIYISDAFVIVTVVMCVVACFARSDEEFELTKVQKFAFGGIFTLVFATVIFMCITWTFVKMDTLYGFQGKYLMPAMPMLLIALRGKGITINKDMFRTICFVMAATNIMVALNAFVVILQR